MNCLVIVVVAAAIIILLIIYKKCNEKKRSPFSPEDEKLGKRLALRLKKLPHEAIDVGDDVMSKIHHSHIDMIASQDEDDGHHPKREHMAFSNPEQSNNFPYLYYTLPYTDYNDGMDPWAPNLYAKAFNDYPAFETSGWSYAMRPGLSRKNWTRNRWIKNNNKYFFINNDGNYKLPNDKVKIY